MTSAEADILTSGEDTRSYEHPHAFHLNLPAHHLDDDGIPLITKYAYKKSRNILRLLESMQLTETMLLDTESMEDGDGDEVMEDANIIEDNDAGSQMEEEDGVPRQVRTLNELMRACTRLSSQVSSLESLKHCGLSQFELCQIVIHILKLATATYTIENPSEAQNNAKVTIYYENVGYICRPNSPETDEHQAFKAEPDAATLESDLESKQFALPSPAREVLLSMVVNMLSNKGPLRSVSNAAIYPEPHDQQSDRFLLILHWQALLRTLLRTAPYLDEHKAGNPPMASNSRQNTIVKRTVQLIRDARHFFDQGLRPNQPNSIDDRTAEAIWEMVKTDVMFHSHTHACYRSLIILYLFQPSRCTAQYYLERMPEWFEAWTNIDRCPEIDFLYLALFCRARKHMPVGYDWGPIRRRLLTHAQYWLQLPIGGASLDKSFPNAAYPRSRSCPSRLKVFAGASSSYEEGIDFVAKVAKLLVIGLGTGDTKDGVSEGSRDVLRFLNFVTPYFNPSNLGSWTFTLGAFLHYFCYELCCRVGCAASMESMKTRQPALAKALCDVEPTLSVVALPPHEVVSLMNALLPLCQQALYSKNGHVGRAGEAAMLYLSQMDPARVTPSFIDFATRALGVSAVNLAHQAPAALSALTRLLQPALRNSPKMFLVRLPEILGLTLAGIDSNDQNKTIRTLILYRSLTSWMPVGGSPATWKNLDLDNKIDGDAADGTIRLGKDLLGGVHKPSQSAEYLAALESLPESSLLKQGPDADDLDLKLLVEEAASALSDWVLEFLDRVYSLLRATGEREKAGKTASGVASRHSSADVQQARNFSRVLKECLIQTFASMDDEIHSAAVKSVARFLTEETLPQAAKDASLLCQAACAARIGADGTASSPGLGHLVPLLVDDLEHHSSKTVTYRLRCLAGAVRSCGVAIKKHKSEIVRALEFSLSSKEKHVFKTGCKLLRHTLSTCCESYAFACDTVPRVSHDGSSMVLGRSAQLHNDPIHWHIPDSDCVQTAWDLLQRFVFARIKTLAPEGTTMNIDEDVGYDFDFPEMRRCLRVIRYALRGGAGMMVDADTGERELQGSDIVSTGQGITVPHDRDDLALFPYENAVHKLLRKAPDEVYGEIVATRGRLCSFIVKLTSLIASETSKLQKQPDKAEPGDTSATDRKYKGLISADSKICKETSDISLLLLTRRGAAFRSQEGKTIWKAQKQLATDFALLSEADHATESLQRAGMYAPCSQVWFKDGEDAGKTLPRRLLVARMQLFHDSLQRTASFEVPRRLRKLSKVRGGPHEVIFSASTNIEDFGDVAKNISEVELYPSLQAYEGIIDGLCAMCCHSNTQVRASAIGVVDYAITRYGWFLRPRIPRLLAAVKMTDETMHTKFGIPSCATLKDQVDGQGRRKRLAEAMKGVCSILAIPRAGKLLMSDEKTRFDFVMTICGTEDLVSIMPPEEMQKMVHYLHSLFSPFRLKFYSLQRATRQDRKIHLRCLEYLLDILSTEKTTDGEDGSDAKGAHWRKLMHACWFLTVQVDNEDLVGGDASIGSRLWRLCFQIIEQEHGQPLQRVALGLFGRLVMMTHGSGNRQLLRDQMVTESFCRFFGNALVYDHKEDSSVGGGHDAQWAAGVADMIRDSARNVAPRSLFPFQRTNQSSGTFKISHAQLVEQMLLGLEKDDALLSAKFFLQFAKEMASSPPSEDQRNQQCTSAEIFAGVSRAFLQKLSDEEISEIWEKDLLPYLDEVIPRIPISLSGAYFDSVRFAIQFSIPKRFFSLTAWLFEKIEGSLWDSSKQKLVASEEEEAEQQGKGTAQGTDGFTAQSKWLYLCCALLVELDETEIDGTMSRTPWYTSYLSGTVEASDMGVQTAVDLQESWKLVSDKLLPRLTAALGHPYESCRDHIAGCLFRICYCHRKMARSSQSRAPSRTNSSISLASLVSDMEDPGSYIVQNLLALQESKEESYQVRYNSLITARRFFSYCIHFGEAKHEYTDYIIPLLPLAFEALNSTIDDGEDSTEADTVAKRALEAEVVKGYRYTIAEVSVASVMSYGGNRDISRVLAAAENAAKHEKWQVRHAAANFLRCFQGSHKFLFTLEHADRITSIAAGLLSDERREVSSAAMAAVTGIIAALPTDAVAKLVKKYVSQAKKSTMKRKKKITKIEESKEGEITDEDKLKEMKRAKTQQSSVFFLCATVLSQPYDTPPFVPKALAAISKHSFERNAPLGVRDIVKKCCAEYKRTHMSDNWEVHRKQFTQEEIEALEDVVSSPHYYA